MKKLLITICSLALLITAGFGQAKKPSIMILPSDVWCNLNGYMTEYNDQGTKVKIPDYKRAFQENVDLINVISKLNGLMGDRGFRPLNAEAVLKDIASEAAENNLVTGKDGSGITESPVDKLRATAKADIIMQLTWNLNVTGPKKSVTFNLQGLDSYTNKQIATAQGTGDPSFSAEVPVLLEEAVLSKIDNFNTSLQAYFDDMFENGREISIRIKKFDSWSGDFEKEYDGKELNEIIEDWINKAAVKGRVSHPGNTENMQYYDAVRIPIYDANGKAIDARGFTKGLQKFLEAPPYSIPCKLMTKGLGQATIIAGYKK